MMKWLRIHSKQIMVVTVLLAMFSFVGGSALVQILSPSQDKDPVLKALGKVYLQRDLHPAQMDTEILNRMGVRWQYDQPDQKMTYEHWHCLAEEAEKAGMAVSDDEVEQFLDQLSQKTSASEVLETMRVVHHFTPPQVRHAIRRHLLIWKNAQHLGSAAAPSEPQLRRYVKDTQDTMTVQYICLDAEKFVDANAPLAPDQIQAQFDKYKDVPKGQGEAGDGYKYPRRVKIQTVVANIRKIEPQLTVSFEDVKNHWKANKSKYRKTIYEEPPPTSEPATTQSTSAPTSQPKPKPVPKQVEKTIGEARADVERELRKKNAQRLAEQAMTKLAVALQKPWLEERIDPQTGYKPIPPGVNAPSYLKELSEKYGKEFGITLEYKETGLVPEDELDSDAGLRGATVTGEGTQGLKLSEFAFRVPPFFKHEQGADTTMSLQLFQSPDAPMAASDFNFSGMRGWQPPKDRLILFRVVEASDAQPPATVDEVRPQVEKDLRLAAAMKALEPRVKELYAAAKRIGLKEAWSLFDDLKTKADVKDVQTPPGFARFAKKTDNAKVRDAVMAGESPLGPPDVPGLGSSQEFADACFEMTAESWSNPEVDAPQGESLKLATTRPALTPAPAVRMVSLPKLGKWCLVEKLGLKPVNSATYEGELREKNYMQLAGERGAYLITNWFKVPNVEKRCGFERIRAGSATPPSREGVKEEPKQHPLLDFQ